MVIMLNCCEASYPNSISTAALSIFAAIGRVGADAGLAYLGSPGTAHLIDAATRAQQLAARAAAPLWQRGLAALGVLRPATAGGALAVDGADYFLYNGFINLQGPNYALAKSIQMWRAMVARHDGLDDAQHAVKECVQAYDEMLTQLDEEGKEAEEGSEPHSPLVVASALV